MSSQRISFDNNVNGQVYEFGATGYPKGRYGSMEDHVSIDIWERVVGELNNCTAISLTLVQAQSLHDTLGVALEKFESLRPKPDLVLMDGGSDDAV